MNETTNQDGDRTRAKALAERGYTYWKQGNLSAAIEWYTRALAAYPDDAWTLMRRGVARAAISDIAGAIDDLNRARSMMPEDAARDRRRWASAQLGEGIRYSLRDAVLAPDSSQAEVEAVLAELDASREALTEALREDPKSAWAHAHRGAAGALAYWLGARFGVEPDRVGAYAAQARADLDTAVRLDSSYAWALILQAFLWVLMGSNVPEGAERQACFGQAAERLVEAGRANKSFAAQRPLAELALYGREYDKVVELGWSQLAKESDDPITRYCVAVALQQMAASDGAGDSAIEEMRRVTASATLEQTRNAVLAKRSRMCGLLGGLAMLEGKLEVAVRMLDEVLEFPDIDTLTFMSCDPAWAPIRQPAAGAENDPRFKAVQEAYARLFPRRGG